MVYTDSAAFYSIMGVVDNAVLSKTGSISVCFYLDNPEPYSLDENGLQQRHTALETICKTMIDGTYVHKQDVFLSRAYDPAGHMGGKSFLQRADMAHFTGRRYLEHFCILAFTLAGLDSLEPAYIKNVLMYKEALTRKDRERLRDFLESVESALVVIKNLPGTSIRPMQTGELKKYLYHFVNGFSDGGLTQLRFGEKISWGEATGAMFTISDEEYLPDQLPVYVPDDTLRQSNATLSMSVLERVGIFLKCNHVYNQIIYLEGAQKLKNELGKRVILMGQHRRFAKDTALLHAKLDAFQTEVLEAQALLCRAHFSVLVWDDDPTEVSRARDFIREALKTRDIVFFEPKFEWLFDAFAGTILGRVNKLHPDYYFLTDSGVAAALFIHYSVYRDDQAGSIFCDRVFQKPLRKDLWDEQKKRIPARNKAIIASTGGGKSATGQSLVNGNLIEGTNVVVAEFGNSFKNLTRLHPDISAHIDYDGVSPLGVNPFYIRERGELTPEKLQSLTNLVLKFWREKEIKEDAHHTVSLNRIIADYYEHTPSMHSFPDFYRYVETKFESIIARQEIPPKYFDKDSFIHICREFLPGGIYESVCMAAPDGNNEDKLRDKQLIVFELTRIEKDPFLISVVLAIIFDTVENKILFDRSKRGELYLDEYGQTATIKDDFTGADVHKTVAFYYQKFRKENGAVNILIQTPDQLPDDHFTKSIIANTQILIVLPTNEKVYNSIIHHFQIKNEAHIKLMRSIRNDFSGTNAFAEIYIRYGDLEATVVRLEFSRVKYFAFQTEGPDWQYLDHAYRSGLRMEDAISQLIEHKKHSP